MKLPPDTVIASEKLTNYLLVWKAKNDKSQWLAQAGYVAENWRILQNDLRIQLLSHEAVPTQKTSYGQVYEIIGALIGPNGVILSVQSVWMTEKTTGLTKFITLFPYTQRGHK